MPEQRTHYGACNLCEAICGLEFTVTEGRITQIKGDPDDPLSHGHICPKAVALQDIYEDPDRLRRPQLREGDSWREIDWDEALDRVADRLAAIHEKYGANAIGAYAGNPNVHNYGSLTHAQQFLSPLKTRSRFSATSIDQLPHQLLGYWMYGHQFLVPIPDIDRTQYFLMFGANPMASNGSIMTVPGFRQRLKALQGRGGKLVVFDPRRSETAAVADEHHFVRPGADAAILLALLKCLLEDPAVEPGPLAEFTDGLDEVRAAVAGFALDALAAHGGLELATIRRLAREFAAADGAVCYGRMGVSTQEFGTLCQWLIQLINIVSGNLDRPGGVMFTTPAVDLVNSPVSRPGHFNAWRSRVRELPEFGGELPCSAMAEEILTPGEGQIRAMVTMAGNPVLSTPDGTGLAKALQGLEFMVSIDIYKNETTRHADVILPPTCALEHDHYDLAFHHFAVRNTARFNAPLFDKPEGTMHDWEIFQALGQRLCERLGKPVKPLPPPAQVIEMGLRSGPHRQPADTHDGLSLAELQKHPHGVDLGPLQSCLPQRLYHADKRIRTAMPELMADLERLRAALAEAPAQGLRLIGRRHVRTNNSWMHNAHRLVKGKPRHQLLMHPDDLAERGLSDGQRVHVKSRAGEVEVEVAASDEIMPGVVSLPHGFGHRAHGNGQRVAAAVEGASVNDLTDPQLLDPLCGNAAVNGVPVEVSAAA